MTATNGDRASFNLMPLSTAPYALVVDDDPIVLMDACRILEDAGFRVLEADDGDHAKRMLEEHGSSITLLFSDVEMPGETDGFALARHAAQRWPEIAIVISSGRLKPEADDMPKGATFIGKPFGESVVHDHLRKILPDGKKPELLKEAVS